MDRSKIEKEPVQSRIKVFICYAHEDEALKEELEKQLSVLKRQDIISVWHDRDINVGTEWEKEILAQLNAANIILLLVSPDFIDSDYCYKVELERALARHERGEVRVIPVILRPVYWQKTSFRKLQALPKDAEPVKSRHWHSPDEAFHNVAEGIREAVEAILNEVPTSSSVSPDAPYNIEPPPAINNPIDEISGRIKKPLIIDEQIDKISDSIESTSNINRSSKETPNSKYLAMRVLFPAFFSLIERTRSIYQSLPLSLRGNQLLSANIGIVFCSMSLIIIQICALNPFTALISFLGLILVFLAPLFFGATFGCWAGSLTGGLGIFLGTLFAEILARLLGLSTSMEIGLYVSPFTIDLALMGFLIGLIWYSKHNAFLSFRSFMPLEMLSLFAAFITAIITYPCFIIYFNAYDRIFNSDSFQSFLYDFRSTDALADYFLPTIIVNIVAVLLFSVFLSIRIKRKKRKERKNMLPKKKEI